MKLSVATQNREHIYSGISNFVTFEKYTNVKPQLLKNVMQTCDWNVYETYKFIYL